MQVSAHNSPVRYAFQAGHEGSIPFARSNQKPQVNAGARPIARSHQEAFPRFRARCVPDRPLAVPFRLAVVNTSPMAAAIASSRSLVAC